MLAKALKVLLLIFPDIAGDVTIDARQPFRASEEHVVARAMSNSVPEIAADTLVAITKRVSQEQPQSESTAISGDAL